MLHFSFSWTISKKLPYTIRKLLKDPPNKTSGTEKKKMWSWRLKAYTYLKTRTKQVPTWPNKPKEQILKRDCLVLIESWSCLYEQARSLIARFWERERVLSLSKLEAFYGHRLASKVWLILMEIYNWGGPSNGKKVLYPLKFQESIKAKNRKVHVSINSCKLFLLH